MRIGMILDAKFPPDYRVEKEALTLTANGHDVILFCLDYTKPHHEVEYKGFKVARYPSNKLEYKLSALAYTVPFYHRLMGRKIRKFIEDYRPDVLHVHDMVIAEAAFNAAGDMTMPIVLDLHENRPASMAEYRHLQKFPGSLLVNLDTWKRKQIELADRANAVIVVTDLAKTELLRTSGRLEGEVFVVPNTSDESFANDPIEPGVLERMAGTFNLLYIGDTSIRRGTADAVTAMSDLATKIPGIRLWIVGSSSADGELKELAQSLKVDHLVQFEGWQPQHLFASYITGSDICISPLRRNPHHDTTFANKVFQYMALGRPVLVSDCPAQAELIETEKAGLVHKAGDVADFSEKVQTLFNDRQLRETAGRNAKRAVLERWHWEKTSAQLLDLYSKLG